MCAIASDSRNFMSVSFRTPEVFVSILRFTDFELGIRLKRLLFALEIRNLNWMKKNMLLCVKFLTQITEYIFLHRYFFLLVYFTWKENEHYYIIKDYSRVLADNLGNKKFKRVINELINVTYESIPAQRPLKHFKINILVPFLLKTTNVLKNLKNICM